MTTLNVYIPATLPIEARSQQRISHLSKQRALQILKKLRLKNCRAVRWNSSCDRPITIAIGRISLLGQWTKKRTMIPAPKAAYCHLKHSLIKTDHPSRRCHSIKADHMIQGTVSINYWANMSHLYFCCCKEVEISKEPSQAFPDSNTKKNSLVSPGSDGSMAALEQKQSNHMPYIYKTSETLKEVKKMSNKSRKMSRDISSGAHTMTQTTTGGANSVIQKRRVISASNHGRIGRNTRNV